MTTHTTQTPSTQAPTPAPHGATDAQEGGRALDPAKAPVSLGTVTVWGTIAAIGLLALAAVAVRDALVQSGAISGTTWLPQWVRNVDGTRPAAWMLVAGIVAVLLGLYLVLAALKPRPTKVMSLRAQTGIFLHPGGAARLAARAAEDVDGVLSAKASASRRKVAVTARTTAATGIDSEIARAVTERLSALDPAPRVTVKTHHEGAAS